MDPKIENGQSNNLFVFQTAISQAFKGIAECVSEEEFKNILTILQSKDKTLQKVSKAFMEDLCRSLNTSFEEMLEEGSLTEGFAKVSRLSEEASSTESSIWRPPGDAKLHLRSHDAEVIEKECRILEKQVSNLEVENAEKIRELSERRRKLQTGQEQTTRLLTKSKIVLSRMEKVIELMNQCIKNTDFSESSFA